MEGIYGSKKEENARSAVAQKPSKKEREMGSRDIGVRNVATSFMDKEKSVKKPSQIFLRITSFTNKHTRS
jgi:hypothetical protein